MMDLSPLTKGALMRLFCVWKKVKIKNIAKGIIFEKTESVGRLAIKHQSVI